MNPIDYNTAIINVSAMLGKQVIDAYQKGADNQWAVIDTMSVAKILSIVYELNVFDVEMDLNTEVFCVVHPPKPQSGKRRYARYGTKTERIIHESKVYRNER